MTSLRSSILASASLCFAVCALLVGCGQTTGPADTGPDASDVVAADQPTDAQDVSSPDVASDAIDAQPAPDVQGTDATSTDAFDSGFIDVQADVQPDVTSPDVALPDASGLCNTTINDAPLVTLTAGTGTAPTGTGGSIVPGHYQLTSLVVYGTSPPAISVRESIDLTSTTLQGVAVPTGMPEQRVTLSYTVSGNTFNDTQLCPAGGMSGSNQYTADATHLIVISPASGITSVGTFTLH